MKGATTQPLTVSYAQIESLLRKFVTGSYAGYGNENERQLDSVIRAAIHFKKDESSFITEGIRQFAQAVLDALPAGSATFFTRENVDAIRALVHQWVEYMGTLSTDEMREELGMIECRERAMASIMAMSSAQFNASAEIHWAIPEMLRQLLARHTTPAGEVNLEGLMRDTWKHSRRSMFDRDLVRMTASLNRWPDEKAYIEFANLVNSLVCEVENWPKGRFYGDSNTERVFFVLSML